MRLRVLLFLLCVVCRLRAQESGLPHDEANASRFPEAEFAASTSFRSGSYVQPLWKGLRFEGDYFGGEENDVGFTAGSWRLEWKGLRLSPGVGVIFGSNGFKTMPGISFRWAYEKGWFITEGLIVQGLLNTQRFPPGTPESAAGEGSALVRPTITDGDHVSFRWSRLTVGGAWEHIQFREDEWKGGGRAAFRILPHLSAVVYVLGPRAEVRGGLILHPIEEK